MKTYRHGGNLRQLASQAGTMEDKLMDFSANMNPLGPPEWYRALICSRLDRILHYPDPDCLFLVEAASRRYGVKPDEILAGNGSTEIIYLIPRVLSVSRALIPVPAYADYAVAAELAGVPVEKFLIREEEGFVLDLDSFQSAIREGDLVFIGQPNNPTGYICDAERLRLTAQRNPSAIFVIDEAFADFVEENDSLTNRRPPNVLVLCSLTKFFAIPGLRLGLAIGDAHLIDRLREAKPPWSVNALAQAMGEAFLNDGEYTRRTQEYVRRKRETLIDELRNIPGLTVFTGAANFLLLRSNRERMNAKVLADNLIGKGIAIRVCDNFDGLDSRYFRVAVRTEDENARLCDTLREALNVKTGHVRARKTPAVMFQGTSSNAGKSVLAASLCRILLQDGYRVAPFKAQNMSLNSFVTREGGEMGRAQVVQAQACRLEPDVRMNPILLKPNTDTGSQVIVLGKPVGNMDVAAYTRYKNRVFETVKETYDSLASEYDAIVLEGAGSPAEINLKSHDIVNMKMARHAGSPVLLVGDIDRGGVFASFVGTMEVLSEWERALIAGFIINRFRGDARLLESAIEYTRFHTGRPTFGIVPYIHNLGLPEEDSVTFKNAISPASSPEREGVDIALIDLPHISNFTDFDSLRSEPDVRFRIVRSSKDIGQPDAVILPGSKNVVGDLDYLFRNGLAQIIVEFAGKGKTELIGICGGFQILGRRIADPHKIESAGRDVNGMGLLAVSTTLQREKTLAAVRGRHVESRHSIKGYEIHHGRTSGEDMVPAVVREDGEVLGIRSGDGMIWGTYLHGIFDADDFRRWFIDRLRVRRGLSPVGRILFVYDLDPSLDRLADAVRGCLNIDEIYRIMGLR